MLDKILDFIKALIAFFQRIVVALQSDENATKLQSQID